MRKNGTGKSNKSSSLLLRVIIPMIIITFIQIIIFVALLYLNGGFANVRRYSYSLMIEKTSNRKSYIENEFNQKTYQVTEAAENINHETEELLKSLGLDAGAIKTDKSLNKQILSKATEYIISLMRHDLVNDAFIILDSGELYNMEGRELRPGVYLRDTDISENSILDNEDIYMEMGASEIARSNGISLDFGWTINLDVTDRDNFAFYYKPIETYADYAANPLYTLGYWSSLTRISARQERSVKYSLPLVTSDGYVYGVVGIGLLEKTIAQNIPVNGPYRDSTCYVLGLDEGNSGVYEPIMYSGAMYGNLITDDTVFSESVPDSDGLYEFTNGAGGLKTVGCIEKISLYSSGSPYRDQSWAFISVADKKALFSNYYSTVRIILLSLAIALVICVMSAVFMSMGITRPITRLVGRLDESRRTHSIVRYENSGIREIDTLAGAIAELQTDSAEYASRVSRIIAMSGGKIGVFMYEISAGSVFVGESLTKILGIESDTGGDVSLPADIFRRRLRRIDSCDEIGRLIFSDDGVAEGGSRALNREISYTDEGGALKWYKFSLTFDNNRVMGLVQDITESTEKLMETNAALKVAYESAERANSTKTDFLSRMSHDIRTPMNAIIGMTAIAENYIDDKERLKDCFGKINSSSRYLLALINEVLDMSKIEAGKFVLSEEDINLPELSDTLVSMVEQSINAKDQHLTYRLGHLEHENVIGDSLRIQQVFMNIMSNAVKYTQRGGSIMFSLEEKPTKNNRLGCYEMTFTDNGKGMSREFLQRLFKPFERENDEQVRREQGTGLGMTITNSIVRMMNGHIDVQSEPGKGSTFRVTVYLSVADVQPVSAEELKDVHVLVVDDDEDTCFADYEMMRSLEMRPEYCTYGRKAIEMIDAAAARGDAYSILILDWKMPDMSGIEIARELGQREGGRPLMIMCTAYDWSEIEYESRKIGIDAFLSKPVNQSRLATVMKSVLGKKDANPLNSLKSRDYSGYRVLLVDDNELNLEIAEEILSLTKLKVDTARDGQEAVDKFSESEPGTYSLIFMDIMMPGMNGYEASKAIRALDREDAASVPIIAMSANAFAEDVRSAYDAGMNDHIPKPIDMDKLEKALQKWIKS